MNSNWPERLTDDASPDDGYASLEDAARAELVNLWDDLEKAIDAAHHGGWSTGCIGIAERIHNLTQFVGPTRWNDVSIRLLESGVWQRLHAEWGIAVEIDAVEFEELRRWWHDEYLPKQMAS